MKQARWSLVLSLLSVLFASSNIFAQSIVINEIMYHPPDNVAGNLEFVEIYNYGASPLDISGFRLTEGIFYQFPEGTWISSYSYLVVAKDPDAFKTVYGFMPFGPFTGNLDDSGELVALCNDSGSYAEDGTPIIPAPALSSVRYNDRGKWPSSCNGAGHSLCLISFEKNPEKAESWAPSPYIMGSPGDPNGFEVSFKSTTLIKESDTWRFKRGTEEASNPIEEWRQLTFDASGWEEGQAGFGYGDNDDTTVLDDMKENGDNPGYITVYIRKKFTIDSLHSIDKLSLNIFYDDGFVAYLNGHEIARGHIADDPPHFNSEATSHEASRVEIFDVSDAIQYLTVGENVLAVEGHNQRVTSPDFSLNPYLLAIDQIDPVDTSNVVFNECYYFGNDERWFELYNKGDKSFDLSGYNLSRDPSFLDEFTIPQDTLLAPKSFKVFTESEIGFSLEIQPDTGVMTLFLSAPDLKRVAASRTFDNDVSFNSSMARVPDGTDNWFETTQPTKGTANKVNVEHAVVINEIMFHPFYEPDPYAETAQETDHDREYVELYNTSDHMIDLSGWRFSSGISFTFHEGTTIGPNKYLVIAYKPELIQAIYNLSPEQVIGPFKGGLSNSGETLRLKDVNGNITDEVNYSDGGEWAGWSDSRGARWADGGGSSLELIDPRQDNNTGSAWGFSDDRDKAKWTRITFSGKHASNGESQLQFLLTHAGEMLLDDVTISENTPDGTNMLKNPGFEEGDKYWRIWDGTHEDSHVVTGDAHGGDNALLVVSKGHGDNWTNNIGYDLTNPRLRGGRTYYVSFWAKWQHGDNWFFIRGHRAGLASTYDLVHSAQIPVPENLGTPGARNSIYRENQGPVFKSLKQSPAVPKSSEPIQITCVISDSDGIAKAELHYKRDRGTPETVEMFDDGAHGDGNSGDNTWGAAIPPIGKNRQIMAFWITATDTLNETENYPPMGETEPFVFQVIDTATSTRLPTYRVIQLSADAQRMNARLAMSNSLVPASFVFNEKTILHHVGIRYRGSPWIRPGNKGSGYLIRFNSTNELHGRIPELNLDHQHPDGFQALTRERTAYYLMRYVSRLAKDTIVPYSYQQYVSVLISGSSVGSIYEHVFRVDKPYLGYWFGSDDKGALFKTDDWFECNNHQNPKMESNMTARFLYRGDNKEMYRWYFKLRTDEKWDDYTRLIELTKNVNQTQSTNMAEELPKWIETEEWLTLICVRHYIGDWDTIGFNRGKNAFLYMPPGQMKWYLLPWDSDLTFQSNYISSTLTVNGGTFPSMSRMFNIPAFQRRLYQFYDYLISGVADINFITTYWDKTYNETFTGETQKPPSPSTTIGFMNSRNNFVRQRIYSGTFRIRKPSQSESAVFSPDLNITGESPTNISDILLNGESINDQLSWRTTTTWTLDLVLAEGSNVLNFVGLDTSGEEKGNITLTVHYTNNPAPEITSITPSEGSDDGLPDSGNPDGKVTATIKGANFLDDPTVPEVFFGTAQSPEVTFIDSETLEVVVPPSKTKGQSTVNVRVANFDTRDGTLADGFTYYPLWPDLQLIQPDRIDCDKPGGSKTLQLFGERFQENTKIYFDDIEVSEVVFNSPISLSVTPPCNGATLGPVDVKAQNPDGRFTILKSGFSFACTPKINGFNPPSGPVEGGYNVTIEGSCFQVEGSAIVVTFNFQLADIIEAQTDKIVVKVPAGSAGPANVVITDGGGQLIMSNDGFTYTTSGEAAFIRGDVNRNGRVSISDSIILLHHIFDDMQIPCEDAADVDDNGKITFEDAMFLLQSLFTNGSPPAAPYPQAGADETPDELNCSE